MKYAKIEIINIKNKRKTSHLSASPSIFLRFTFLFFIFILIFDLFPSRHQLSQPSSLKFFFVASCIPLYQAPAGSHTEGILLLSSTSVLSSPLSLCLKTQKSSISLTYIIYIFSLFHPFTALHNCLMGWDTFFVLPLCGPFSTLKLSHRNWRKGWSGWMVLNFFLIGVLWSMVCQVTW